MRSHRDRGVLKFVSDFDHELSRVKEKSSESNKVFAQQGDRKVVVTREKVREEIHG